MLRTNYKLVLFINRLLVYKRVSQFVNWLANFDINALPSSACMGPICDHMPACWSDFWLCTLLAHFKWADWFIILVEQFVNQWRVWKWAVTHTCIPTAWSESISILSGVPSMRVRERMWMGQWGSRGVAGWGRRRRPASMMCMNPVSWREVTSLRRTLRSGSLTCQRDSR